jgi:hypothetical protein
VSLPLKISVKPSGMGAFGAFGTGPSCARSEPAVAASVITIAKASVEHRGMRLIL